MIVVVQEVTSGDHGRGKGSKDDGMGFGQETQLEYNAFNLFDYVETPPLSLSW